MFVLFNRLRFDEDMRHEMAANISGNRTYSTAALTPEEADHLIILLKTLAEKNDPVNRMRRKMLYYAHKLGWELPDGKVDMEYLNAWCLKYGRYHKQLDHHS